MCHMCEQGYHILSGTIHDNRCICCVACNTPPENCTLCEQPIGESPLWGIDFPKCGPVHDECADLDYWHYRRDGAAYRNVMDRHIRDYGWLPTPCAVPIY